MPKLRIGVGGSAANPPHLGHKQLVETLMKWGKFDKIIWIPSGERSDKPNFIKPHHRETMTKLMFSNNLDKNNKTEFIIRFDDIYGDNTPTIEWFKILDKEYPGTEIVWYTGIDSVMPQEKFKGKCEIEAEWYGGETLMREYPFLIVTREGYPDPKEIRIPPQFKVLDAKLPDISSTEIRKLIAKNDKNFEDMVTREVAKYIKTNKLYGWKGG